MTATVELLNLGKIDQFWRTFSEILSHDFPNYSKLTVSYFLEKMYTKNNFEYWLNTNQKAILIANTQSGIVGFAVIDQPYGGVSFCRWLGVKKEFRRQGIGRKLVENWINLAKKQNCHKIEVAGQPEAKEFYSQVLLDYEGKRSASYFGITQYLFGKVIGQPNDKAMTQV